MSLLAKEYEKSLIGNLTESAKCNNTGKAIGTLGNAIVSAVGLKTGKVILRAIDIFKS